MNVAVRYLFTAVIALQGCASETVLRVPDSAPVLMDVMWVRVGSLDLATNCRNTGLAMGGPAACAVPAEGRCTIYTTRDVSLETLGHEIAHCYLGAWHR